MILYARDIEKISKADSLSAIEAVVAAYSAKAYGEGGILYCGHTLIAKSDPTPIDLSNRTIALEIAEKTGANILDYTPRGHFLSNAAVDLAITRRAKKLLMQSGAEPAEAARLARAFLHGDAQAAENSLFALETCLWGNATSTFVGSLSGAIHVIAAAPPRNSLFTCVALPHALSNEAIDTLGGKSLTKLLDLVRRGNTAAALRRTRTQFRRMAEKGGVYLSPDGRTVKLSREAALRLGLEPDKFAPDTTLSETALSRGTVSFNDVPIRLQERTTTERQTASYIVRQRSPRGLARLIALAMLDSPRAKRYRGRRWRRLRRKRLQQRHNRLRHAQQIRRRRAASIGLAGAGATLPADAFLLSQMGAHGPLGFDGPSAETFPQQDGAFSLSGAPAPDDLVRGSLEGVEHTLSSTALTSLASNAGMAGLPSNMQDFPASSGAPAALPTSAEMPQRIDPFQRDPNGASQPAPGASLPDTRATLMADLRREATFANQYWPRLIERGEAIKTGKVVAQDTSQTETP